MKCTETFWRFAWPYMYFRIRGYGLSFMWRTADWIPLFSERNGYDNPIWIGRLRIKVLKP
jgi:hypothetical protein